MNYETEKNLAKRVISKTKADLDEIFDRLIELQYFLQNCDYYDKDALSKERKVESKLAMVLLYLDSMENLVKDLEASESEKK